ncbi:protein CHLORORESPIRATORY REDUCTION 42, chloroplastic [Primulina tabacum]|uniref:protein CHLORORESPIRATORY REDUCTION 42, chloroplastic n=1 Tax=Primulina tabacum TaxID=48773 RepID=UPI003F5915F4
MALNLSFMLTRGSPSIYSSKSHSLKKQFVTNCELNESKSWKLEIGSPIIVIEAPQLLKTAASVPCLRANSGLIKPGDVGRIVSRKPKDVWAVRLSVGTYLIDGKYFKPLELPE